MATQTHSIRTERVFLPRYEYVLFLLAALMTSVLTVRLESSLLVLLLAAAVLLAGYTLSDACLRTWPYLFVASALAVPPVYSSLLGGGETPVYIANFLFVAGCFVVLARGSDARIGTDAVEKAAAGFLLALALSIPFGFWFSGTSEGIGSCLRFFLLLHPFLIYYWLRGFRPVRHEEALILAGK